MRILRLEGFELLRGAASLGAIPFQGYDRKAASSRLRLSALTAA
jgi:hypothetical protein